MEHAGSARNLGRVPLIVVGAGPAGVAALWYAGLEGIPAIGIDAALMPLASVEAYMDGLVVISHATHFEIPGLPLDCRDPFELTREEILHYYSRVIHYGKLDVRCATRCTALVPRRDDVIVEVLTPEGPAYWVADNVVVTAWHEARRLLPDGSDFVGQLTVHHGIQNPAQVAGKRCVVIGGGASSYEQASAMMLCGQSITILTRGPSGSKYSDQHFRELLEATSSTMVDSVSATELHADGVSYSRQGSSATHQIDCDVAVVCIGQQISDSMCQILQDAGVLSQTTVQALKAAPTVDDFVRRLGLGSAEALRRAIDARPDLWNELFSGVNHVRLAGGALHMGGPHAGVVASIFTAGVAIKAILGCQPPSQMARPLPKALLDFAFTEWDGFSTDVIGDLRPLALRGWSRTARLSVAEHASGVQIVRPYTPEKYLLGSLRSDQASIDILRISDGQSSVRQISEKYGLDYDKFVGHLQVLWKSNALTWLPPA